MLRSNANDLFLATALPVLEALIMDEYEKYQDMVQEVFNYETISQWGTQTVTYAGIKPAVLKNEGENVAFDDPIQGFAKTYIPVEYSIAVSFSQVLVEDDRLNLVEDTYRSLGMAMYQTVQIVSFNVLNNGFSDTGPDGQSLFNSAHVMIGGHSYENRPSTDVALSIAGIRQMEVDLIRQVNHRNINIMIMPEQIVVPPELSQVLDELVGSPDRPDTPNRAINTFYKKNYRQSVSPFLTSTTAWFALANKSQHKLKFVNRVSPQTETWQDKPSGSINTKIRCRFDVGYSDFIGAWGTTG